MTQLWNALIYLARRPDLIPEIRAVAAYDIDPAQDPVRRKQPNRQALADLHTLLNTGERLRLAVYDLAEINRFALTDNFLEYVIAYAAALDLPASPTPEFDQTAGMLLMDPEFRQGFAASADPLGTLAEAGFVVSESEAQLLHDKLALNSPADHAARDLVSCGWVGSSCLARLDFYSRYVHPNY